MTAPPDPRTREREALETVHRQCPCKINAQGLGSKPFCLAPCACMMALPGCTWPGHAAILAYGRAVREADKEAAINGLLEWAGERNRYTHPELIQAIEAAIGAREKE